MSVLWLHGSLNPHLSPPDLAKDAVRLFTKPLAKSMLKLCPNEQLIAHLFDTQPDSVIWFVPVFAVEEADRIVDFVTRYSNTAASTGFGLTPEDIIGEHLMSSSLIDDHSRTRVFEQCLHVWRTGESVEFTYHSLKLDKYFKVQRRKVQEGILNITQDCSREVKAELGRKEQERKYQQLLDASGDGVLLLEAIRDEHKDIVDFYIAFCNKWGRKIARFSPDAVGKSLSEVLPHLRDHEQFQWHKKVIETGEPMQFETSFRTPDGVEYGWFIVSLTKMGDGVVSRYTDITQRRSHEEQIETQKEELQSLLDSSINAVLAAEAIRDENGKITDLQIIRVNASFTKLTKVRSEEAEGARFLSLFPCYDAIRIFAAYRRVIETGESLRTEFSYHSDILSGWFDISAVKWGKNRVVISFSDVSAIKKVQVELEKTVHELKRSNKSLEEFAYAASHDLQEPLRKIQLFSDRLHHSLASQLDTAQQNMFSRIFTSAERLRMLIDNLITFSSINQQPSAFEKVSLQQVVGDVLLEFDDVIKDKAALVQVDELPTVCGDRMQLHQLFQNLVSNALKYTKTGQSPKVHVRSSTVSAADAEVGKNGSACEKRYLKIEIEDNGIGFDMKYAEKIFHVFQRLHGNDQYKGTGVGLSIVQKVVNNHKGIIRAQSKVGEGSCFQLLLPV